MNKPEFTKAEIARHLGRPISDAIWQYAVQKHYISEAATDPIERPKEWLANEIRQLLDLAAAARERAEGFVGSDRRHRRDKLLPLRRRTISDLLADLAGQWEQVLAFRSSVLRGQLVEHEQVGDWIQSRRTDSNYQRAILVRLPLGVVPAWTKEGEWKLENKILANLPIEGMAPKEFLAYSEPGAKWVSHTEIGRDGVLADLKAITKSLASIFRWQEAQATVFVLTGKAPLISNLRVNVQPGPASRVDSLLKPLNCLGRIAIDADPLLTPREVLAAYEEVRRKVLAKKPRSLSERHMQLASFCVGRELNRATMNEWNRAHKHWQYDRLSVFSDQAQKARQRLLGQPVLDLSKWI